MKLKKYSQVKQIAYWNADRFSQLKINYKRSYDSKLSNKLKGISSINGEHHRAPLWRVCDSDQCQDLLTYLLEIRPPQKWHQQSRMNGMLIYRANVEVSLMPNWIVICLLACVRKFFFALGRFSFNKKKQKILCDLFNLGYKSRESCTLPISMLLLVDLHKFTAVRRIVAEGSVSGFCQHVAQMVVLQCTLVYDVQRGLTTKR